MSRIQVLPTDTGVVVNFRGKELAKCASMEDALEVIVGLVERYEDALLTIGVWCGYAENAMNRPQHLEAFIAEVFRGEKDQSL